MNGPTNLSWNQVKPPGSTGEYERKLTDLSEASSNDILNRAIFRQKHPENEHGYEKLQ